MEFAYAWAALFLMVAFYYGCALLKNGRWYQAVHFAHHITFQIALRLGFGAFSSEAKDKIDDWGVSPQPRMANSLRPKADINPNETLSERLDDFGPILISCQHVSVELLAAPRCRDFSLTTTFPQKNNYDPCDAF